MASGKHAADGDGPVGPLDPTGTWDEVYFDPDPTTAQPLSTEPAKAELADTKDQHQAVTCPECGTRSQVSLNRRRSEDFCPRCDFPLFWTPNTIVMGTSSAERDGLRRLPGTAGRVTVASRACPHCAESNQLSATTCVRCGQLMDPPEPVVAVPVAAPPPAPAPPPEPGTPWWVWAGIAATLVVLAVLIYVLVS